MNKVNLRKFREELKKSTDHLEAQFGIKIKQGNISFDEVSFSMKMEIRNSGAKSKIELDLLSINKIYGYDLEKTDKDGFKLFGYASRSHKYPFIVKNSNGKMMKVDFDYVRENYATNLEITPDYSK